MKRGRLISLEGIDGVGKTTCAKLLCNTISKTEACVYVNRKMLPSTNEYCKLHMKYLSSIMWRHGEVFSKAPNIEYNGFNREHWRYLMMAWYCAFEQHVISPILEDGVSIIMDGYVHKEIAKAIYSTGDFETAKEFDFLIKPDVVFYLKAPIEDCLREDSNTNRIESGEFVGQKCDFILHQTKMQAIYDKLASENYWITICRTGDVNTTCESIIRQYQEIKNVKPKLRL